MDWNIVLDFEVFGSKVLLVEVLDCEVLDFEVHRLMKY